MPVAALARAGNVPVNVVDRPELSTFIFPAIVDRGEVVVAIGTGGASPVLARRLRERIEALLPARIGELAALMGRYRGRLAGRSPWRPCVRRFWEQVVDGRDRRRRAGGPRPRGRSRARPRHRRRRQAQAGATGTVFLVGAGPGDPDLLTLARAARAAGCRCRVLRRAGHAGHSRPRAARRRARVRRQAARRARHRPGRDQPPPASMPPATAATSCASRAAIPSCSAAAARSSTYLRRNDVPVIVVPGITAALGCAAEAGLPLTLRNEATRLCLVTAQRADQAAGDRLVRACRSPHDGRRLYGPRRRVGGARRADRRRTRSARRRSRCWRAAPVPDAASVTGYLEALADACRRSRARDRRSSSSARSSPIPIRGWPRSSRACLRRLPHDIPAAAEAQDHRSGRRHRQPARRRCRGLPHRSTATGRTALDAGRGGDHRAGGDRRCSPPRSPTISARSAPMWRRCALGADGRPAAGQSARAHPARRPDHRSAARSRSASQESDMYLYDDFDRTLVAERVAEFRDQVRRRLVGRTDRGRVQAAAADERRLSAAPRLHAADRDSLRHAVVGAAAHAGPCRRAATTAATAISPPARTSSSTGSSSKSLPDAMADLARAGLHGMQTSGNCVRNITTDQWAGVAPDEIEDPRIWAEILRQHSHPASGILVPAAQVQDRASRPPRMTAPPSRCTTSACGCTATAPASSASR